MRDGEQRRRLPILRSALAEPIAEALNEGTELGSQGVHGLVKRSHIDRIAVLNDIPSPLEVCEPAGGGGWNDSKLCEVLERITCRCAGGRVSAASLAEASLGELEEVVLEDLEVALQGSDLVACLRLGRSRGLLQGGEIEIAPELCHRGVESLPVPGYVREDRLDPAAILRLASRPRARILAGSISIRQGCFLR